MPAMFGADDSFAFLRERKFTTDDSFAASGFSGGSAELDAW
jgi:hypothetical protein